jgi:RHS repeat-associated protein
VYFLKDHLGSIRATVDNTGAVVGYDDYDPWGYILAGRSLATPWSSVQGTAKNKFTGKEWDDEFGLNWNYFGARYYDPQIGRFPVVDRFADKYPSLSPYHYGANNPVLFVDANGDSINFSGFIRADETFKTNVSSTLISDLQSETGLSLSVSQSGMLVYATDENGNPIIATDEKGNPGGSAEARNLIINAINATDVVETFLTPTKTSKGAGLQLALNPKQIESFIKGVSSGLNPKTLGFGMVFMHELLHTKVSGALKDPGPTFGLTGSVVDRMNIIRSQLGPDYGQRLSYAAYPLRGSNYLPFDQAALNRLKKNSLPSTLYIKH